MSFKRNLICAAAIVFADAAGPAFAEDYPAEQAGVLFITSSSNTVTVSVDGETVCTLAPDERCSTALKGSDPDAAHPVHGEWSGSTWDDKIQISECHWNFLGLKTYTFTDEKVPFECKQRSDDIHL